MNPSIKSLCDQLALKPRTVIEFGAAHPTTYRLAEFLNTDSKVVLVEANPRLFYCLTRGWNMGDFKDTWPELPGGPHEHPGVVAPNAKVLNAAITETDGDVTFYEANASSFVKGVLSPTTVNDNFNEIAAVSYTVPGHTIRHFDDGQIDVLLADVEGSEWWCLNGLVSRPGLIVLELWGQRFQNAHMGKIMGWMQDNGYHLAGRTETDGYFARG